MSSAKKLLAYVKESAKSYSHEPSPTYLQLVEVFPLQPITSKAQHSVALNIVEKLIDFMDREKSKDEGVEMYLATLTSLVGDYERNQFASSDISGVEMLSYLMELQGLNQSDLAADLGGQSVVSKILKGERDLNLRQIKALAKRFKVPAEVFM